MKTSLLFAIVTLNLLCLAFTPAHAANGKPYTNGHFHGRIAYSADGNHNDPDDASEQSSARGVSSVEQRPGEG